MVKDRHRVQNLLLFYRETFDWNVEPADEDDEDDDDEVEEDDDDNDEDDDDEAAAPSQWNFKLFEPQIFLQ